MTMTTISSKNCVSRCSHLVAEANEERRMFVLMEAVLSNSPLVLGTLIAHLEKAGHVMADMAGRTDKTGRTLLTVAVRMRSLEMAIILAGKDGRAVNVKDETGDAPLHVAVRLGAPDIVSALLEIETCSPNVVSKEGQSPLHIAVSNDANW